MSKFRVGQTVRYWSGAKVGEPSGNAEILEGPVMMGRTQTYRIRKPNGRTDYIATTHLESSHE
jgi:hypothetical protein